MKLKGFTSRRSSAFPPPTAEAFDEINATETEITVKSQTAGSNRQIYSAGNTMKTTRLSAVS